MYTFGFGVVGILLLVASYLMLTSKTANTANSIIVGMLGYGSIVVGILCLIAQFAIWMYLWWTKGH